MAPAPCMKPCTVYYHQRLHFTKHMKLGHSVYVYVLCTSIVVGLAQRSARKICRLILTHHHDVDQS